MTGSLKTKQAWVRHQKGQILDKDYSLISCEPLASYSRLNPNSVTNERAVEISKFLNNEGSIPSPVKRGEWCED